MTQWKTHININKCNIGEVNIQQGIYQGDGLSPLWFCLALNPLSMLLKNTKLGYRPKIKDDVRISHLLFIDDMKLFAENEKDLTKMLETAEKFNDTVGMKFNVDKCAIMKIHRGKVISDESRIAQIPTMTSDEQYKYLGIHENQKINHSQLKVQFTEEYRKRITKLLNTSLNGKNMIHAINTYAVPALTYSFGVVKWRWRQRTGEYIKLMCMKLEINMEKRLRASQDKTMKKIIEVDKKFTPLNLTTETTPENVMGKEQLKEQWKSKALHGRYPKSLENEMVDREMSLEYMRKGYLFAETEGFLTAIQDRVIRTKNYEKHILKLDGVVDRCRKCKVHNETIEHVIGGCSALADNVYLGRHNQVAKIIHIELAKKYELIQDPLPFYKYTPEPVLESRDYLLYWDRTILTDKTVDHNKPDIVFINKKENKGIMIDVAVPLTHNIQKTEVEKVRKYEELKEDMKRTWKLTNITIIPIVISSEGVTSKCFKENLERLRDLK
ncbi:uncharacterized protein LOC103517514 [Diaphorina citri]|uniref:Uncharacterized protein LOC103517514 n=1 Tax=Diaphorina citri TaxID=121845 RepID=A0A1S3DFN1_DIACI|nr:uncharacterized protein LOC103517514 [Diaphorina citri]